MVEAKLSNRLGMHYYVLPAQINVFVCSSDIQAGHQQPLPLRNPSIPAVELL